ncbi:MAG: fructosamine kinase family protein [Lewinellaceae bacterium]|nr:fructosamine kinase family protein [Phaeodactylibacter sp.]MCB9040419.1 fructosamine kinase family protein [Lewinellaceae bacterium]
MIPQAVRVACEEKLGVSILQASYIGGGDINEARLLETGKGFFFLKMNARAGSIHMFEQEAQGLRLLGESGAVRVPRPLGAGQAEGCGFLVLEYIKEGPRSRRFWENFGMALSELHRHANHQFGLDHSNYIGSLPQSNRQHGNWPDFYILERLEPQASRAIAENSLWAGAGSDFEKLYKRVGEICPEEPPALIHGDLWSGNFLSAPNDAPVLIDPAVSFSHREMDLAMSQLFGGFSPYFYQAYQAAYPCQPGLEERIEIYQLYYLLAHVNLFGSGYVPPVRKIVERFS